MAIAATTIPLPGAAHGLHRVLGARAWQRLPAAVRARFGEPVVATDYVGEFDIVRASRLGRWLALLCLVLGTPVAPRTGVQVPAVVHVGPTSSGVAWERTYRWPGGGVCHVRSTKVITPGGLVERLPARLCMPLRAYEEDAALHFSSVGYYFDFGRRPDGRPLRLYLPQWLSPGTTHVEHRDEGDGWFRFTMTVTHARFGELYYQTGRFRAAGKAT